MRLFFLSEAVDKLVEAGKIAARARDYGASLVKPGVSAREVCEEVESLIIKLGARPAFPCNFSINEVAAHYTPGVNDDVRVEKGDVVKVDVGAHIDGYIADTAITVVAGGEGYERLLEAVREALYGVVDIMKPNIRIYDIGKKIESVIKRYGYKPVRNLTGHTIDRYLIHSGTSIPNYPERTMFYKRLKPGTLVAIEPFGTNGKGMVRESQPTNIYSYTGRTPRHGLNDEELEVLTYIIDNYKTLPFTPRWLAREFGSKIIEIVRKLEVKDMLHGYPMLVEAAKGKVAQFEHTFLLLKDKVIVTTKSDLL